MQSSEPVRDGGPPVPAVDQGMAFLAALRGNKDAAIHANPSDAKAERECPYLWQLLTLSRYSDGSVRIPSTVKVTKGPGTWSVTLLDDEEGIQLAIEVNALGEVWKALERALADPMPRWKPYKSFKKPQKPTPKPKGSA